MRVATRLCALVLATAVLLLTGAVAAAEPDRAGEDPGPFSLRELVAAGGDPPPEPQMLAATDGVELAVRAYTPGEPRAALVFYHGGGAHSGAGYPLVARGLRDGFDLAVYTPDIRGHGASGGPRGDAPSVEQVLRDVSTVVAWVRAQHPGLPVLVGGHSSGAGLAVNYASWDGRERVFAWPLVSPQLGFRSDTAREDRGEEFAQASVWPFVVNAMTGLLGHYRAVVFAYPPELLENDPGMVDSYTVNLANAITPQAPHEQVAGIGEPLAIVIGADDELFVPSRVVAFAEPGGGEAGDDRRTGRVIPDRNHLGILVDVHSTLGPWITRRLEASSASR